MNHYSFRFTLITAIMLLCSTLQAQDNLKRGYIIRPAGEIVHGFIDVTEWGMNPSRVLFKTYPADTGTYYDPYDIKEFGMNQEVWQGGFVDVELSSRDSRSLSTSPDLYLEKDLVFLQMVIKGPKPLYVYSKAVNEQFYIKSDTDFELLVYKKYLKDVVKPEGYGTNTAIVENKKYQGQLIVYFDDCPQIRNKISKTGYKQDDLENLFYEYSKCTNTGFERLTPIKNISLKLGGVLGYSMSTLDYNFINDYNILEMEPYNCKPIMLGLSLDISRPVSKPRWSIYNELAFHATYNNFLAFEGKESETVSYKDYYDFVFHSFKLVNMLRYKYPVGKFNIFVNAGISNELYRGEWTRKYKFISPLATTEHEWTSREKINVTRIATGVGVKYAMLSLEARYEPVSFNKYAGPTTSFVFNVTF